jgi:hypothetical protein
VHARPKDAIASLSKVYEVARWYFTVFLPTHDKPGQAPPAGLGPTPLSPPIITVIAPSEGERREAETRWTIRWNARPGSPDARIAGVGLELWKGDTRVESIAGGGTRAVRERQSFDWNVPATLKPGDQYRVKVTAWDERGQSGHGYSGAFSILPSAESRVEPPIEHSQKLAQEEGKTPSEPRLPKSLMSKKTSEKPLRKNMSAIVLGVLLFGAGGILALAMITLPPKAFHPNPWISKLCIAVLFSWAHSARFVPFPLSWRIFLMQRLSPCSSAGLHRVTIRNSRFSSADCCCCTSFACVAGASLHNAYALDVSRTNTLTKSMASAIMAWCFTSRCSSPGVQNVRGRAVRNYHKRLRKLKLN